MAPTFQETLFSILQTAFSQTYTCAGAKKVFTPYTSPQIRILNLRQGAQCIAGGLPVEKIHLLVAGKCYILKYSVDGKSIIADTMYPVQLFGLYELLQGSPTYEATVTAASECVLLELPAGAFRQALYENISIALLTLEYLAGMVQHNFRRNDRNLLNSGMENLLLYIHQYCTGKRLPTILPVERKIMSEELGINLRTLYRYINRLKEEGLISIQKGKIQVTSEEFRRLDQIVSEISLDTGSAL